MHHNPIDSIRVKRQLYFNDCTGVITTVRLNRKSSGVVIGRGLLVAMEAVSKTAVYARESSKFSTFRGFGQVSSPAPFSLILLDD